MPFFQLKLKPRCFLLNWVPGLESGRLSGILTGSEGNSTAWAGGDSGVDWPEDGVVLNTGDVSGDSINLNDERCHVMVMG